VLSAHGSFCAFRLASHAASASDRHFFSDRRLIGLSFKFINRDNLLLFMISPCSGKPDFRS
jgi:hypothetical protein